WSLRTPPSRRTARGGRTRFASPGTSIGSGRRDSGRGGGLRSMRNEASSSRNDRFGRAPTLVPSSRGSDMGGSSEGGGHPASPRVGWAKPRRDNGGPL